VEAGHEVEFLNSCACNHGVTAAALDDANCFNILPPASGSYKHRFAAAKRPVIVACPFQGGMAAGVFVFDHPYYAETDAAGKFRLPAVPPGEYTLMVQQPGGGMRRKQALAVRPGEAMRVRVELTEEDLPGGPSAAPARSGL
jgi:hypothetical protein